MRRDSIHRSDPPNDPIYEANVAKIGLFGGKLAGEVAFAYQQIHAFRMNFVLVLSHHGGMKKEEIAVRLGACLDTTNRGDARAEALLTDPTALPNQSYLKARLGDSIEVRCNQLARKIRVQRGLQIGKALAEVALIEEVKEPLQNPVCFKNLSSTIA